LLGSTVARRWTNARRASPIAVHARDDPSGHRRPPGTHTPDSGEAGSEGDVANNADDDEAPATVGVFVDLPGFDDIRREVQHLTERTPFARSAGPRRRTRRQPQYSSAFDWRKRGLSTRRCRAR
jgi:hypothetical protein